ncbi:hypothetical protein TNCV_4029371 [Trichonephila clavipes]|nr:hypothetical protein TNCV_4029371 [Trichonephila clavipes]
MVLDGTELAVEDIERLFDEARRDTKAKHEKWAKYYDRRRRDVQIKVNDWILIKTHPLSSATKKVVSEFKPKLEDQEEEQKWSPDQPMRSGHNKGDQFESEVAENISTAPTSKSKQGQQVGRPETEVAGEETRNEQQTIPISRGSCRICQLQ